MKSVRGNVSGEELLCGKMDLAFLPNDVYSPPSLQWKFS